MSSQYNSFPINLHRANRKPSDKISRTKSLKNSGDRKRRQSLAQYQAGLKWWVVLAIGLFLAIMVLSSFVF